MMLELVLTGDEFKNPQTINFEEVGDYFNRAHGGSRYGADHQPVFDACALAASLNVTEGPRVGITKTKKSIRF